MKKLFSLLAVVITLGLGTIAMEAEAKRMGSGKSTGMQRQAPADKPTAAPAAAPTAAGAAAAPAKRSWMGPIAGLAAGLGLAALASHLGFGEELANMLMMGLLVVAVIAVIGFVMRKRAGGLQPAAAAAGAGGAFGGQAPAQMPQRQNEAFKTAQPAAANSGSMIGSAIGSGSMPGAVSSNVLPAGFDVAAFERNAKTNFIRLQAANDAGNVEDIRQFTTPEMFAELKMDLAERGDAQQKTDVVSIHAQVLEVTDEGDNHRASVRFTGVIKDSIAMADDSFDEVWHLIKPRHGQSGWVLAGIQQMV